MRIAAIAAAAAAALALKRFYSGASVEELRWILAPTAALVSAVSGEPFVFQPGLGYVSRVYDFAIAAPCAGVNFLIVSACSAVLATADRTRSWAGGALLLAAGFAGAAAWTVPANAARILVSLAVPGSAHAHRVTGIAVFLGFLFVQQFLLEKAFARD